MPLMPVAQLNFVNVVELAYVQVTVDLSVTATTEGAAQSVVSAPLLSFDGATRVCIEFFCPEAQCAASAGAAIILPLYEDGSSIGFMGAVLTNAMIAPVLVRRFMTPTVGSHTYDVRAYRLVANGTLNFGAGGVGVDMPGYIRITRNS